MWFARLRKEGSSQQEIYGSDNCKKAKHKHEKGSQEPMTNDHTPVNLTEVLTEGYLDRLSLMLSSGFLD
jgi:hypothetical protein